MNKDTSAICSDCHVSQRERHSSCINGNRYHNFVRTQISEQATELRQIWEARV